MLLGYLLARIAGEMELSLEPDEMQSSDSAVNKVGAEAAVPGRSCMPHRCLQRMQCESLTNLARNDMNTCCACVVCSGAVWTNRWVDCGTAENETEPDRETDKEEAETERDREQQTAVLMLLVSGEQYGWSGDEISRGECRWTDKQHVWLVDGHRAASGSWQWQQRAGVHLHSVSGLTVTDQQDDGACDGGAHWVE